MIEVEVHLARFGERLREVRVKMALNQADFAALGGVKKNTQVLYESGRVAPGVDYLYQLSVHDIDIGYVLTGQTIDGEGGAGDAVLLTAFNRLSAREREAIVTATTILAGQTTPLADLRRGRPIGTTVQSPSRDFRGEGE